MNKICQSGKNWNHLSVKSMILNEIYWYEVKNFVYFHSKKWHSVYNLRLQFKNVKWQQTFHLRLPNRERVGPFSFSNRLNDIIPLFREKWLNVNEPNIKMILKTKILETFLAKCDNFFIIFFRVIIAHHSCITKLSEINWIELSSQLIL